MPRTKGLSSLKAEIRRINARFRKLRNNDGPLADRLRSAKDALIDEMAACCGHPEVIATAGRKAVDGKPSVPPLRLCCRCGLCESAGGGEPFKALKGIKAVRLPLGEYAVRQGQVLKRLGINV